MRSKTKIAGALFLLVLLAAALAKSPWPLTQGSLLVVLSAGCLGALLASLIASARDHSVQLAPKNEIDHSPPGEETLQLQYSQKMQTVGKLAGGIAHEFNSILTAIIGQSELLLQDLPEDSTLRSNASEIQQAAQRAAVMTGQLLAYGRKQSLRTETLDLNAVLAGLKGALRHQLKGDSQVRVLTGQELHPVRADLGQIEQVIVNIALNAADAMPNGGTLTLETANITLSESETPSRISRLPPGGYVKLAISDTGVGLSDKVKSRIFEPFFTTKKTGEGSGLGLSTAYGIIKQSGGHITVDSEPSQGSTFTIYLPQAGSAPTPPRSAAFKDLPAGTETILFVEDDPALRAMTTSLLQRLGYTVWPAANGEDALRLLQENDIAQLDLLFTSLLTPPMDGQEIAKRIQAQAPSTKVLFTAAHSQDAPPQQGTGLPKEAMLLAKPFTPSALARRLREILDESSVHG